MAVFDDGLDHKVTVYDNLEQARDLRRVEHVVGASTPTRRQRRAAAPGVLHFLALVRGEVSSIEEAKAGLAVVRSLEQLQASLERERV